jgi:Tol biopolymer transport system component
MDMKSNYQDQKQLEQLIRSTKADFAPPAGLLNKVKAALAAAPEPASARKSVFRQARKLVHAFTLIAARPPVTDGKGNILQLGDRLPAGCKVMTGEKGRVSLITRGGSELTLNSNSKLALAKNGKEATLSRGELYCRNRAHEFAAILTAAGRIELLGTTVDANMKDKQTVAVTVVEGKVRLENAHGEAIVDSGKKSLLNAQLPPEGGETVNTATETAWYDGRGSFVSDSGKIAYAICRSEEVLSEIWVMNKDGSGKQRVKSFIGGPWPSGPWLQGTQQYLVSTFSPAWVLPDNEGNIANNSLGGWRMFDTFRQIWLLDVGNGQTSPFKLPDGFKEIFEIAYSPDDTRVAISSFRQTGPNRGTDWESGIWVCDLKTGTVTRVTDNDWDSPAWSPDGQMLAVSKMWNSSIGHQLAFVSLADGKMTDPGVRGTDAAFSPDGTKIAYVDDYQGDYGDGTTTTNVGRIYVMDLVGGVPPTLVSPKNERARQPHWSPDGSRLLYTVFHRKSDGGKSEYSSDLYVSTPDGSETKCILQGDGCWSAWAPNGDLIYNAYIDNIMTVSPHGAGIIANLGGNKADSLLTAAEQQQVDAATAAIQEAIFQYAVAKVAEFKGKIAESRAAFRAAADIFAGLPFNYPLVGFSTNNVIHYTDSINALANRSDEVFLEENCKEHMDLVGVMVPWYANDHDGTFAPDLATLKAWIGTKKSRFNAWPSIRADIREAMFKCPSGLDYIYTPPAPGTKPKIGEVVLACPHHSGLQTTWKERYSKEWLETSCFKGYSLANVGNLQIRAQ